MTAKMAKRKTVEVTPEQRWQLVCAVTPAIVTRLSEKDGPRISEAVLHVVNALCERWEKEP